MELTALCVRYNGAARQSPPVAIGLIDQALGQIEGAPLSGVEQARLKG